MFDTKLQGQKQEKGQKDSKKLATANNAKQSIKGQILEMLEVINHD